MIMRFRSYLVSALIATSFVACKVDYDAVPAAPYGGELQVSFNNYLDDDGNFGYLVKDMAIKDTLIDLGVEIKLANTTSAAPQDINVYIRKADEVVGDYNTLTSNDLYPVPTTSPAFIYDFSKPVVIKKGERRAFVKIQINPSKLDVSKKNSFGMAISDVKNGASVLQGLQSRLVVNINIRNSWDGSYRIFSRVEDPNRPTISPNDFGGNPALFVDLVTTGGSSNQMYWVNFNPAILGHVAPLLAGSWTQYANAIPTFNWDNNTNRFTSITNGAPVLAPQNRSYILNTAWNSTSNQRFSNKTIVVRYQMLQAGFIPVNIFDSLVYLGPR